MDLLTPEDQSNIHYWASVLLAHAFIGFMVAGGVSGIARLFLGKPNIVAASLTVSLGYLILWEVMIQGLGAGVRDAFIDSFAFFAGAAAWVFAATRNYLALGLVAALIGGIIAARMENDKDNRD